MIMVLVGATPAPACANHQRGRRAQEGTHSCPPELRVHLSSWMARSPANSQMPPSIRSRHVHTSRAAVG
jgi:hypothetical protein